LVILVLWKWTYTSPFDQVHYVQCFIFIGFIGIHNHLSIMLLLLQVYQFGFCQNSEFQKWALIYIQYNYIEVHTIHWYVAHWLILNLCKNRWEQHMFNKQPTPCIMYSGFIKDLNNSFVVFEYIGFVKKTPLSTFCYFYREDVLKCSIGVSLLLKPGERTRGHTSIYI